LGCEVGEVGPARARVVESDATTKETTVPGVYAAGDAGNPIQSVVLAAASGANAAYFLNHSLATEDADRTVAAVGGERGTAAAAAS
jgi:thioredoxin reductase